MISFIVGRFCFTCIVFLHVNVKFSEQLACKDERNQDVDWYLNYKIPKIDKEPSGSNLAEGKAYAYISSSRPAPWRLSTKTVESPSSFLWNTLESFYANKMEFSYLFYNDDPPSNYSGTAVGHLKGVVAFDGNSGYWLIHSIPKFADSNRYQYPGNAFVNGQSILCVTFKTSALNEISNQLLYSHPNIYAYALTDEVASFLDDKAKTLFTKTPSFVRKAPLTRTANLRSLRNKAFVSFAKDNQYEEDLYSGLIAPGLKSSLIAETWRRGSGTFLPPSCKSDYSVVDIVSINMTLANGKKNGANVFFKSTEDHSKWAISVASSEGWICIADMNRMASQERRGGGAMCFKSAPVWTAYRSIVAETDQCPTTRKNSGYNLLNRV